MFAIVINEKGGEQKRLDFDKPEVTIGRVQGNDIILPKGNVSKRHSRIVLKDGKFIIVDLKSTNGTYVNGRKITSPLVVKGTDKIYIGDFILSIEEAGGVAQGAEEAPSAPPPQPPPQAQAAPPAPPATPGAAAPGQGPPGARPAPPPPPRPTRSSLPVPPASLRKTDGDPVAGTDSHEDAESSPGAPAAGIEDKQEPSVKQEPKPEPAKAPVRDPIGSVPPRQTRAPLGEAPREAAPQRPEPERPSRDTPAPAQPPTRPAPGPLDRPTLAADRFSDKATMAVEAPRQTASPVAATINLPPASQAAAQAALRPTAGRSTLGGSGGGLGTTQPAAPTAPPRRETRSVRAIGGAGGAHADDPQRRRRVDLMNQVVGKAIAELGLATLTAEQMADTSLPARVENLVGDLVDKLTPLPPGIDADPLTKDIVAEIVGAGPLDDLMADETVHEVVVTNHDRIYVDRGAGQVLSDKVFSSAQGVLRAIDKLSHRAGGRPEGGLGEMRLDNGAILQIALPPRARVPSLILRRSRKSGGRLSDLVNQGVLSAAMSEFLELCMRERRNLIVSGYGRSVMMGAMGGATGAGARVVTVEPVSELDLSGTAAAWIGLFARGTEARGVIAQATRLHPDHLIITDVRGPEALDVSAALCGGQGVVVGVDAASARDAVARLESLARLSNESPPRKALREELVSGLHIAVHVGRTAAGAYRVMEVSEVTLSEEGGVELLTIFSFKPEGADGQFAPTGHVPAFAG